MGGDFDVTIMIIRNEIWSEALSQVKSHIHEPAPEEPRSIREKERVVSGKIKWKPVDRAAAMLLAKAPWQYHPPPLQKIEEIKNETSHKKRKSKMETHPGPDNNALYAKGTTPIVPAARDANGNALYRYEDIAPFVIEQVNKLGSELTPMARAAVQAREVLIETLDALGKEQENMRLNIKVLLEDIRSTRFSVVSEIALMATPLKDLRQFFLQENYESEIKRLREFVELCERLKALKDSGFLDTVADTMLRLASR